MNIVTKTACRREWSLREYLLILEFGLIIPLTLFAAWLVAKHNASEHARHASRAAELSRELSHAADGFVRARLATLRILADDPVVTTSNLKVFQERIDILARTQGIDIALFAATGETLVMARTPFGGAPAKPQLHGFLRSVAEGGKPRASHVLRGDEGPSQVVVALPVTSSQGAVGVLAAVIRTAEFAAVFGQLVVPDGWTLGIADQQTTVVARSDERAGMVGAHLPALATGQDSSHDALIETVDEQGTRVVQAVHVSPLTHWVAAAWTPSSQIETAVVRNWVLLGLLAAGLLAATAAWALLMNGYLAVAFDDAVRAAEGRAVLTSNSSGGRLAEANRIREALAVTASRELLLSMERQSAADQLKQMLVRFRAAEEGGRGLVYDWDVETGFVWRSEGMTRVLGYADGEVTPTVEGWRSLIHPEDQRRLDTYLASVTATSDRAETEYRVRHRDGHYVWFLDRARIFRGPGGDICRIIGSSVDVTTHKTLQFESARLSRIVEESPDIIASADADLTVTYVNRSGRIAMGLAIDEPLPHLVADACQDGLARLLRDADATGVWVGDSLIRTIDGEEIPVSQVIIAHRDFTGRVTDYSTICRNVSDRVRAERHQRLLVAELSHRTRNLLAIIQSVAARSLHDVKDGGIVRDRLLGRITALGVAHDLLIDSDWRGVLIERVVERIIDDASVGRIVFRGPDIMLTPQATQNFALILFELKQNAATFGALSGSSGSVEITWDVRGSGQDRRFTFCWRERGGPPVNEPARRGFGHDVLDTAIAQDDLHPPKLTFAPDGVRYELDADLSLIAEA